MKTNKIIFAILFSISAGLIFFSATSTTPVQAAAKEFVCNGLPGGCTNPPGTPTVNSTLANVINLLTFIIAVTAIIMIMIGGFKYIVSSGDSNGANSAKNTVIYAIVGLAIAALAQVLVRFVLKKIG